VGQNSGLLGEAPQFPQRPSSTVTPPRHRATVVVNKYIPATRAGVTILGDAETRGVRPIHTVTRLHAALPGQGCIWCDRRAETGPAILRDIQLDSTQFVSSHRDRVHQESLALEPPISAAQPEFWAVWSGRYRTPIWFVCQATLC
jgi:hypothetical protein